MGRLLTPADNKPGAMNAVLSYDFWRRRMSGASDVVGRTIRLNGLALQVVGVLPQQAQGLVVDTNPELRISIETARLLERKSGDTRPETSPFSWPNVGDLRQASDGRFARASSSGG